MVAKTSLTMLCAVKISLWCASPARFVPLDQRIESFQYRGDIGSVEGLVGVAHGAEVLLSHRSSLLGRFDRFEFEASARTIPPTGCTASSCAEGLKRTMDMLTTMAADVDADHTNGRRDSQGDT